MSGIGTATSKQANVGNVAGDASTQLVVASSSSAYPTISALATSFEQANPSISVIVDQVGSAQAMVAVATGAAEIGISSDIGTYQSAVAQYPAADLQATEMGAGAMVVIEHGTTAGSFLSDGTNPCYGITQAALQEIFQLGTFSITTGACLNAGSQEGVLDTSGVTTGNTFTAYIGPDEIAAAGTVAKYLGVTPTGTLETSEALVESAVASHTNSIAFIELGFNLNSAGNVVLPQPQIFTLYPTFPPSFYLSAGSSAEPLQAFILASLTSSSNTQWPDNLALTSGVAPGNLLTNHFQIVTDPNTLASEFIQYITGPTAVSTFESNGLLSTYQYSFPNAGASFSSNCANPTVPSGTFTPPASFTLTVIGATGAKVTITQNTISDYASCWSWGGFVHGGLSHDYGNYTGIPLLSLVNLVGGIPAGGFVNAVGSGNYNCTYTYDEVTTGTGWTTESNSNEGSHCVGPFTPEYSITTGGTPVALASPVPMYVILAYMENASDYARTGSPGVGAIAGSDGPLRTVTVAGGQSASSGYLLSAGAPWNEGVFEIQVFP